VECNCCLSSSFGAYSTADEIAIAHIIESLRQRFEALKSKGSLKEELKRFKKQLLEALINENLANEVCKGLKAATGRVLGVTSESINRGICNRANIGQQKMNEDIIDDKHITRATRLDKYPRDPIYNFFHGEGNLLDYSAFVHIDKNVGRWVQKKWKDKVLTCQSRSRTATKHALANEYKLSETHLK
jgi:hypothetical protein